MEICVHSVTGSIQREGEATAQIQVCKSGWFPMFFSASILVAHFPTLALSHLMACWDCCTCAAMPFLVYLCVLLVGVELQ